MKCGALCYRSALAAAVGGLLLSAGAWANDPGSKFAMMDTNRDGKISSSEHAAGARKMFEKMDANGDGRVTATEMDASHKGMKDGVKKDKPMLSSAEKIRAIDSDGDGVLTAQEHEASSRSMFEKMDTNKDGALTEEELRAGHSQMMHKDH